MGPTPSFLNRLLTLWIVGWRVGVLPTSVEGVFGTLRRKSVRSSDCSRGEEMLPNEEPDLRRSSLRWRCAPSRQIDPIVRRMPTTRPGKNPTKTACVGKGAQFAVIGIMLVVLGAVDAVVEEEGVVAAVVEEDVGVL